MSAKSPRDARVRSSSGAPDGARTSRFPGWRSSVPLALVRASHPRQAVLTTVVLATAAAMSGRSTREVGLVIATVLVGQVILGWHNDVVDARRDRSHARQDKPIAVGHVEAGTVTFAILVAVLLVVPLSIANGITSGISHLLILAIALAANFGVLRRTRFSYLTWMASYALFPAFLSYGGWGGEGAEGPPTIAMTLLAALLGIGIHVLVSLPGLVDDNKDGLRHFPLQVALRTGAPKLLVYAGAWTALVCVGILIVALTVGLVQ